MKIEVTREGADGLNKKDTVAGEVYLLNGDTARPYLRADVGFVELCSGTYTSFSASRSDNVWVHHPDAKLVL